MSTYPELHQRADELYKKLKVYTYEEAIERVTEAEYIQECVRAKLDSDNKKKSERPAYMKVIFTDDFYDVQITKKGGGNRW